MRTATYNDLAFFAFLILSGVWSASGGLTGWVLGLVWLALAIATYIDNKRMHAASTPQPADAEGAGPTT